MTFIIKIIAFLEGLIKTYPITATIIVGIFTNLLTDAFKKVYRLTLSNSASLIKKMSITQLKNTIEDLKSQIEEILKFQKDPVKQYSIYLAQIQRNFFMLIFMIVFLLILKDISGVKYELGFYGSLGFSISRAFRMFLETIYNINFVEKVSKPDYHLEEIEKKINLISSKIAIKQQKK